MAALGLRRWLSRLKRRNARPAVLSESQRMKRWRYRPFIEQLEDRLAPGSLLTRPIVSDDFWKDEGLALPLARTNRSDDSAKSITRSQEPQRAIAVSGAPQNPAARAPSASGAVPPPETAPPRPFTANAAADLSHTPLDINLFAALESVFEPEPPAGRGGSASESSGGQGGAAAAESLAGELPPETASHGAAPEMSPALNDASGSSLPSFPGIGGGSSGSGQSASTSPAPGSTGGANSPIPNLQPTLPVQPSVPAVSPSGASPASPSSAAQPAASSPAAAVTVLPPSLPVLQSVERFGPAGHGQLLIEGTLANTAPLGTSLALDFFAREPGSDTDRFLATKKVTQQTSGSISFTVNLEAEVPPGTVIAATVYGRPSAPDWSQAVELPGGGHSSLLAARQLPEVVTLPAATPGESMTLESPGHPLENVQVFHPPGLNDALPVGLIGFTVTNVQVGGSAVIRMTLPADVHFQHYYKMDPATGAVTRFDFDGREGAEIRGQVVTLHLVDGGIGDADGRRDGYIVDPGGVGGILPANVDVVPAATNGEMVTLESPIYPFASVQTYMPPATGVSLPLGLFGYQITGLPVGGQADVQMIVPSDVTPSRYIKQDPVTGALTDFGCCANGGAVQIDGQTITLHLVDGGVGDADGVANGIIVDPSGPGAGTITIPCDGGLTGWTVIQTGGSGSGVGTVTFNSTTSSFVITEGNSFDVGLKHSFSIPSTPNILTFDYSNLSFATTSTARIKDAFEAAFVDVNGNSLVPTIAPGRNAFFNITAGMTQPALAPGVTVQNGQVNLDISKLFMNQLGWLVFRLINNDNTTTSTVSISCHQPPQVTVALANDTAPTGPGTDSYRTDRLTNDPTLTGTAKASGSYTIVKLEASWDLGVTYTDITSSLNLEQYTWYPGVLAAGSHTVWIRATDNATPTPNVTVVSLIFTVNVPPVANAGGNYSLNEGSLGTFDGSLSTDSDDPIFSYLWTFPDGSTASGIYSSFKFVQAGTYPVTLAVTDTAGSVVSNTATITVTNLPAVITTIPDQVVSEAGTATFQTPFTDAGVLDTHTASIAWGDGGTSGGTISESGGAGTVTGSHVYLEEGLFTATVTVTDNGGAASTSSFVVTVNDAPPTLTISGTSSVNEGTSYVLTLGATAGPDAPTGWTITWGDGNTSTAAAGATSASHTYADGIKVYTLTATGTTDDGTVSANALVVTVNNIAPAVSISGATSVNEGSTYTLTLAATPDSVDSDTITGWSVNWGDGNTQAVSGNPTSVTHIYLDGPNTYTVSANATDADGSYSTNTLSVTVNNVAPTVTADNLKGQINQTLTFTGNFTDPGVLDTHTYTINWGDGSANTTGSVSGTGNGIVTATHSYTSATGSPYTITLTVTDKDGGAGSATGTATITSQTVSASISSTTNPVNEGATYTLNLSFTGSPAPTSWTVTWGDGNVNTYTGNPASEPHTYADGPNNYTISATATNTNGTYASNTLAVTVNAINPTVSISGAASVNEGSLYTLTLSGTPDTVDADAISSWKVTWGDGMIQNVSGNPTSVTHTYLDNNTASPYTYSISASAIDENGSYGATGITVTVNNVAPTVVTASNLSGNEGQSLSFLGTFTDPGVLDTHTATIAWGDNSTSTGTVTESNGSGTVTGTHVYADVGTYTITLTVTDTGSRDGGTGTKTATATIANVAPTATASADPSVVKNQSFTVQVASFTDPAFTNSTAGTVETFTATINWGDGSVASSGTVAVTQGSAGVLTTGTVTGTHTYTAAGNYTLTVTVTDDDGASGTCQLIIHALSHGATKFFVVDQPAHHIYAYDQPGNLAGGFDVSHNNQRGWGIVSNAAMNTLWIIDANRNVQVYVYKPDGTLLGNWIADNVTSAQDIGTDGADIWIADNGSDKIERFVGGAGWTSGHHSPSSTFNLDSANQYPTGMVTDGSTIWITDDHATTNNVFVYNTSGVKLGAWKLDSANGTPSGITLNPNYTRGSATDLWVVDRAAAKVYRYAGGSAWRSGNQTATSNFALDPGDQHPEGITDPTITIQSPASGSSFPQGGPYLVSGLATPASGATLEQVVVGGSAATVDAGNNFFQQLNAGQGVTTVSVSATDTAGSASTTLSVTGTAPVKASPRNPGAIDFSQLADVTASFGVSYARTSFNHGTNVLYADFTATDNGSYTVQTPLLVGVRHISYPSMRVRNNTGLLLDDTPFYDLSSLVTTTAASGVTAIGPGQSTGTATLAFFDPEGVTFTYDLVFLGRLNLPPRFTSVPVVKVVAGQVYNYTTTAADPDGDYLEFSKVAGPANLAFTDTHAGTLTWSTASTDAGTYPIRLRVSDQNGATADQTFILSVLPSGINYPPNFTSTPVLDANVNTAYSYQATVADLDNDTQTFSVVSGPAGLTVNASTGLVSWTPTASQLGTQSVTLQVTDAAGSYAQQSYSILVQLPKGNLPPLFTTTPVTTVAAGNFYVYPSRAIDADSDPVTYTLTQAPGSMVIDPTTGKILWQTFSANAGNNYPVTILASDGLGGTATQSFTISVTSAVTAPGALFGTKYSDLNGNGLRDSTATISGGLAPIALKQAAITVVPYALDYHQPTNSMLIVATVGGSTGIYRVQADGSTLLYAALPGISPLDGTSMTTVRPGNAAGFTVGDIFVPGITSSPQIIRLTNGGATVTNPWVTLPTTGVVAALTLDTTGVFGGKLLALVGSGNPRDSSAKVYEIDASGNTTLLASFTARLPTVTQGEVGLVVIPNNQSLYGPLAGKLVILLDVTTAVAVDASGNVTYPVGPTSNSGHGGTPSGTGLDYAEGAAIVPAAAANFFAMADIQQSISVADGSQFAAIANQIIVAHEGGTFSRVWYDGTNIQTQQLQFTSTSNSALPWYQDVFAPIGLGPVPAPPLEPGLPNWTIQLINPSTGLVLQTAATDVNGRYAFVNLTAASYTVAEVQQAGWTQKGPAPVPPGTYSPTLASGQSIYTLDFGNQQNATPPTTTTPPSSTPDQPPVFGTTPPNPGSATVGQIFTYNATATDPESDYPLAFDLPVHPVGMAVDPQLGVVIWQPTLDQTGLSATVLLRVTDTKGSVALQSFTVNVAAVNCVPIITSTPVTTGYRNATYYYAVKAEDGDTDTLTYSLSGNPSGMTINTSTGLISWPSPTAQSSYPLTVTVTDGRGGTATQTYTLTIPLATGTNQTPSITSSPRTVTAIGQIYLYQVLAGDSDNDLLTYSLPTAPSGMTINSSTGMVSWTPTASQFGNNSVQVQVSDGRSSTVTQSFTVNVTDSFSNQAPVITSVPPLAATVGQVYAYNAAGSDPNGDPITWSLVSAPGCMAVDPNLGTVRWIPMASQEGNQSVTLRLADDLGASVLQSFTIVVRGENLPPSITSTPVTQTQINKFYSYAVQASDPDGDPLTYSLTTNPSPSIFTISASGIVSGTQNHGGTYGMTITVSDGQGNQAVQSYTLSVNTTVNQQPVITSSPPATAVAGTSYSYQVAASDPDGESLTYALSTTYTGSGPPTISSTGLLSWTSPVAGTYSFTVTVTDSFSPAAQAVQVYTLTVGTNQAPTITSTAVTSVTAGLPYRYDVLASDTDGDVLTYSLSATTGNTVPAGMTIDSATGHLSWSPGIPQIGTYNGLVVTVTDPFGSSATQTFNLTVAADTVAPTAELTITPGTSVNVGTAVTFLVFGSDNVSVALLTLSINGTNVPLDGKGQAVVTESTAGTFTVSATAVDAAGNVSTAATATLTVSNPSGTPPTVSITAPTGNPIIITSPTAVTGTVSDDHIGISYTVTVVPSDGTPSVQIASGSTTTASSLTLSNVTFDPTMLANGDYTIDVKATDTDDNLSTHSYIPVSVEGHLKLGREQLSVTDLTIPVAGIPITIMRSYDSLEAGKSFDFGYGWRLGFGDAKLQVNLVPGTGQQWGDYPAFTNGTHVDVTLAGGEREGFTFTPWAEYDFFGTITYYHPAFTPDPGVIDQLTVPDQLLTLDSNQYYTIQDWGLESYSPADPVYGDQYTVTNLVGLGYQIAADTGKLTGMTAHNGNSLTFTPTSVSSNTGKTVTFTRDPAGHITAITDPRGNSVKYGYDVNGNLISVTDRAGDPATQYTYDATRVHYLKTIVDPLGVQQLQVSYDTNGRISTLTDAKGNPLNFSFNTSALTAAVTDPNLPTGAQTATVTFNSRGDASQFVDPTGAQGSATYNNPSTNPAAKDLPDTVTQVRRNSGGTTTSFTTTIGYDANGDVTSTTDPTGAVTRVTYGPFGAVVTVSDPLGNTVTNTLDTNGNLFSTVSAAGLAMFYGYDQHNNLTSITRGSAPRSFGPPSQGGAVTLFTYDAFGYQASSTSPTAVTTNYSYDGNGNATGSSFTWVNPANSTQTQVVTTSGVFDANDRQTQSIDVYGHASITKYDAKGRMTETDDELGNATKYVLDARDQVIQTTNPDGTVTETVYDAEGRPVYTDDVHVAGQPDVHGAHTIYDSMGRVTETDRLDNIVITVTTTNGVSSSQFVSAGATLSRISSVYNDLGQMTSSTDAAVQTTQYQYDAGGRQTAVVDPLNETTSTGYDTAGRRVSTTDALGHTTQYVLNGDGQIVKSIFADGSFATVSYDNQGRQSAVTDQMGRTTNYQYDVFGRLTGVVLPAVSDPQNNSLIVMPTTQYFYDVYGDMTSLQTAATTTQGASARITQFTVDAFGHRLSRTLPMGQVESTSYDTYGRAASHFDFKNQLETFHYDLLGRVDTKTFYAAGSSTPGETVVYHFDSLGRNDTVTDTIGSTQRLTQYAYDLDNRVTSITTPEGTINYVFDAATGFHKETYTVNSDIVYTPDALQRVKVVTVNKQNGTTLGTPLVTNYFYTMVGNIDHVTYPNGTETDYGYDTLNRMTSVTNKLGATVLSSYVYTLEADGLRTGATETDSTATVTKTWTYDALQRLTQENYSSTVSANNYTDQYVYDLLGNRLSKTHTAGSQTLVSSYQYNTNDQLTTESGTLNGSSNYSTTYGYDANGSLTSVSRTGSSAETDTYGFDLQNRLSSANISRTESGQSVTIAATYSYDDSGFRAQSVVTSTIGTGSPATTTTQFLVDEANPTGYAQVLEEHTNGSIAPSMSYLIGLSVFGQTNASGTTNYLIGDGHGSTRLVTDALGNITARYDYDAYGSVLGAQLGILNLPATSVLYTGERFDATLLQYYLRARFYDPRTGRFPAMDSFGGRILNPSSLQKYVYAQANPVLYTDPSGHDTPSELLTGFSTRAILFRAFAGALLGILDSALRGCTIWRGAVFGAVGGVLGPLIPWDLAFVLGLAGIMDSLMADKYGSALFRGAFLFLGLQGFKFLGQRLPSAKLGNLNVKLQNSRIAAYLRWKGWKIIGGGGRKEEYIPGSGGGVAGSNYVDITAQKNIGGTTQTLRIQTVSTNARGVPTTDEVSAAEAIRALRPDDHLMLVPKADQNGVLAVVGPTCPDQQ